MEDATADAADGGNELLDGQTNTAAATADRVVDNGRQ